MLIRPRNIFDIEPPFLIIFGNRDWKVAKRLTTHPEGVGYYEPFSATGDSDEPDGIVSGSPWHVGDNVWELDYNTQIMTLDHPYYHDHPAWQVWLHWLAAQDKHDTQKTH